MSDAQHHGFMHNKKLGETEVNMGLSYRRKNLGGPPSRRENYFLQESIFFDKL